MPTAFRLFLCSALLALTSCSPKPPAADIVVAGDVEHWTITFTEGNNAGFAVLNGAGAVQKSLKVGSMVEVTRGEVPEGETLDPAGDLQENWVTTAQKENVWLVCVGKGNGEVRFSISWNDKLYSDATILCWGLIGDRPIYPEG